MAIPIRFRFGAVTIGASAVLFTAFPLVRPFFHLDPLEPVATLAGASSAITSAPWVLAHFLATVAFVLLLCGLPVLYARLAQGEAEPRVWGALVASLAGIALVMPTLGVETYALPAVGRAYRAGAVDIAPVIGFIYIGPATWVMLVGLSLLAIGAIRFAAAIWRSHTLPRWAGVILAAGLVFWLPLLPQPIRIADGFLIGIGGVWLAANLWKSA